MKTARKAKAGPGLTIRELRELLKTATNVAVWLSASDAGHGGAFVWSTKKWVLTAVAVLPEETRFLARLEDCEGKPTLFLGGPGLV